MLEISLHWPLHCLRRLESMVMASLLVTLSPEISHCEFRSLLKCISLRNVPWLREKNPVSCSFFHSFRVKVLGLSQYFSVIIFFSFILIETVTFDRHKVVGVAESERSRN